MLRILASFALVAASLFATEDAEACSCSKRSAADYVKGAKRVVIARAGKAVAKTTNGRTQTFTVLATLKGPVQTTLVIDWPVTPPCASIYKEGEVAVLFTSNNDLDVCSGNYAFSAQAQDFLGYLKATNAKRDPIKAEALEAALRDALGKYLHDRPQISVRYEPLSGKSFDVDKSKLTYAKTSAAKDIEITNAVTSGSISFVEGKYDTEGVRFAVLLHLDKTWKVVVSSVVER